MARRVLLVGMNTFDSGKTTYAKLAAESVSESGSSVEYFKPLSAHNYWYSYSHTQSCLKREMLFSYDVATVRGVIGSKVHEYVSNPVHRMYAPTISERPFSGVVSTLGLAGWDSVISMQRFSTPDESGVVSTTLVAEALIEEGGLILTSEEADRLMRGTKKMGVSSFEEIREFENAHYEEYVSDAFSAVENVADLVIIESFNDTVWTWEGLDHVDIALVIGPGQVFQYDPKRLRKAALLKRRSNMPIREVTFNRIADLVKPLKHEAWSREGLRSNGVLAELVSK
ncbi:MAG: hypothetical protein ACE5H4_14005 [Candidatus Thorarchaeota archaeon]